MSEHRDGCSGRDPWSEYFKGSDDDDRDICVRCVLTEIKNQRGNEWWAVDVNLRRCADEEIPK